MFLRAFAATQLGERKRIDIELGDRVTRPDEPDELTFGRRQCRIGHHVQEADVQFTDVLVPSPLERQHDFTARF